MLWIEQSALSDFVRSSFWGWPLMLYLHSVGMGVMLGLHCLLCVRVLGMFRRVPLAAFLPMFVWLWLGFAVNIIGGIAIFSSRAVFFATSVPFLLKMAAVIIAAFLAWRMQRLMQEATDVNFSINGELKVLAWGSLLLWTFAMVSGRLTAYVMISWEWGA